MIEDKLPRSQTPGPDLAVMLLPVTWEEVKDSRDSMSTRFVC